MQIELIETFLDLCETRNFNRTAERLGVTQSTVSGRMRALEAKVGSRLLRDSGVSVQAAAGTGTRVRGRVAKAPTRSIKAAGGHLSRAATSAQGSVSPFER